MVGCLVSEKTLRGVSNKWPKRYPDLLELNRLFRDDPDVINLVHYHTKDNVTLCQQLEEIAVRAGPNLHGFQLNVTWPDQDEMHRYKQRHPDHVFVLQCGSGALKNVDHHPVPLASMVQEYKGLADYVLVDPSCGKGEDIDIAFAGRCLEALTAMCPWIVPGIAGGLGPDTISRIRELAWNYPQLCIDAEGKLRNRDDNLDVGDMVVYLEEGFALFAD